MRLLAVLLSVLGIFAAPALANDWPEKLVGHGGPVKSVSLSADGREALTGSFDYAVIHWRLEGADGTIIRRLIGHEAAVNDAVFIPGTEKAFSASDDGSVIFWDLVTGEVLSRFDSGEKKILDVAVSPNGRFTASAGWDGMVRLFDAASMEQIAALSGHRGNVNSVAFSDDGKWLFSGSYDGTVRLWSTKTREAVRIVQDHGWGINVVRVLPGGALLLSGAVDGVASIVFIETGEVILRLEPHERPILSAAVAADAGLVALGDGSGLIRVYTAEGWALLEEHQSGFGPVWGLSFADDAARMYYVGLDDFAIGWQVSPRKPFEPIQTAFPHRFQKVKSDDPGERQFARKCSVCHTLTPDDANRAGPTLYGLFGRKAGTLPDYPYSRALLDSEIVWTEETIAHLFDAGPDIVTPGTKMPVQRIKRPGELSALIAYLKEATAPEPLEPGTTGKDKP